MEVLLIGADKSLTGYLPEHLFKVNHVSDVEGAYRCVKRQQGDAVLVDLSGSMDVAAIKPLLQNRHLPVIVVVDNDRIATGNRAVETGAHCYLVKDEITSRTLSRSIFSATILKEMKMKADQMNFLSRLQGEEQPCDILFKNFPLGIFLLNRERRIVYSNTIIEDMMRCRRDTLYNHYLTQFIYPDDIQSFITGVNEVAAGEANSLILDSRFLSSDGNSSWLRLYISTMISMDGTEEYILIILRDINKRKNDEELIAQARREAKEANRAKTEFLTNMSHEFRTPIHTIVGMTELLLDTPLTGEQKKFIKQIRFSTDSLLSLINHILDFSRIESGQMNVNTIDFNLNRMLENILDLVIHEVTGKGLELILYIEQGVPELVKGDPVHLQQVIRQLLNNALKFTDRGEIFLSVRKEKLKDSRSVLRFSFKDTGEGVEEEKQEQIFKPFAQADYTLTREYGGAGVGLAIVQKLVELMGGSISLQSEKGVGSEFVFDIPLVEYKELQETPVLKAPFKGLKAMVVQENNTARTVLAEYLTVWGCEVVPFSCESFLSALDSKDFQEYDICFIDILGEAFEDCEVVRKVKEKKLFRDKWVLIKPPGSFCARKRGSLLKEFSRSISKPVRKRDLFDFVQKAFQQKNESKISHLEEQKNQELKKQTGIRILVVEDHEVNQLFFCTLLNKMGYEVETAANGLLAVDKKNLDSFDLVFMDIQMPEMNGYDASRRMRELGVKVPIIAVTANTVKGEVSRCLQAGMNDFMAKPFKKSDLVPLLNKWLQNNNGEVPDEQTEEVVQLLPVFDFKKAVEMFMGQRDVVIRLLGPFVERVARQILHMKEAFGKKEYIVIRHEAHTVKGGALNIQALEMGQTAAHLEKLCRNNEVDNLEEEILHFEETYLRFKKAVEEVLAENS